MPASSTCGRHRDQLVQQFQPFWSQFHSHRGHAGKVAAGSVQAGDKPGCDWAELKDDRYLVVAAFAANAAGAPPLVTITFTLR